MIAGAGRADAGAFLARLLRLDPAAVVRLRPARLSPGGPGPVARLPAERPVEREDRPPSGLAELWAMLPFGVLVTRLVAVADPPAGATADVTVEAAALLHALGGSGPAPRRRDEAWRWPLPSQRGRVIDTVPETEIVRVAAAASQTLREAATSGIGGRRVGERVVRDALLDHISIVVTDSEGSRVDVPQRLVQAVVRMAFLRRRSRVALDTEPHTQGDNSVTVRLAGRWVALECSYGSAWYSPSSPLRLS